MQLARNMHMRFCVPRLKHGHPVQCGLLRPVPHLHDACQGVPKYPPMVKEPTLRADDEFFAFVVCCEVSPFTFIIL